MLKYTTSAYSWKNTSDKGLQVAQRKLSRGVKSHDLAEQF